LIKETLALTGNILQKVSEERWVDVDNLQNTQIKNIEQIISWLKVKKKNELNPALISALQEIVDINSTIINNVNDIKDKMSKELLQLKSGYKNIKNYL